MGKCDVSCVFQLKCLISDPWGEMFHDKAERDMLKIVVVGEN